MQVKLLLAPSVNELDLGVAKWPMAYEVGSGWMLISREEPKVQKGEDMMEILNQINSFVFLFRYGFTKVNMITIAPGPF